MRQEVIKVTPELAEEWLSKNISRNRTVRSMDVSRYARDMRTGRWELNPQGIIFNESGNLMDGQHRLWAVIEADTAVDMVVWFDVPDNMIHVIDSGVSRKMTDHIGFMSDDTCLRNASVISTMTYLVKHACQYPTSYKFSSHEMYDIMTSNYAITRYVYKLIGSHKKQVIHSGYFVAILSAISNQVSIKDIEAFDRNVIAGEVRGGSYNFSAAHDFRLWYESSDRPGKGGSANIVREHAAKSIYCFVKNKSRTKDDHYKMDTFKLTTLNAILTKYWEDVSPSK